MEALSEYPNLPSNEFIASQTVVVGGEVHIIGLTPAQADDLQRYAKDYGVAGTGHNEMKLATPPFSEDEKARYKEKGKVIPDNSVEVYLGHTTRCHKPLFESLGIK